jgi:hypothetical protein
MNTRKQGIKKGDLHAEAALFVCVVGLELGADGQAVHAWLFHETN